MAASNNRDHARNLLLLLARATYIMVLFFAHMPFVVNHTINAIPPERLQHYDTTCVAQRTAFFEEQTSFLNLSFLLFSLLFTAAMLPMTFSSFLHRIIAVETY